MPWRRPPRRRASHQQMAERGGKKKRERENLLRQSSEGSLNGALSRLYLFFLHSHLVAGCAARASPPDAGKEGNYREKEKKKTNTGGGGKKKSRRQKSVMRPGRRSARRATFFSIRHQFGMHEEKVEPRQAQEVEGRKEEGSMCIDKRPAACCRDCIAGDSHPSGGRPPKASPTTRVKNGGERKKGSIKWMTGAKQSLRPCATHSIEVFSPHQCDPTAAQGTPRPER